jgi:predicted flap endonuclease-1-like 5' DNA nuclease
MPETQDHLAPPAGTPRLTLAMRLAERNSLRERRAVRLAHLRAAHASASGPVPHGTSALEVYLPACVRLEAGPEASSNPVPIVLDELTRLPGVGPGLAALLRRAGIVQLADLQGLDPAALAARLGPIGRLIPAARWIATVRGEAAGMVDAPAASLKVPPVA